MKESYLYALITAVVFVIFEPASKVIAGDFSPFAICGIRLLIAGLVLVLVGSYVVSYADKK